MITLSAHYDIDHEVIVNYCKYNDMPECYTKSSIPFFRVYKKITGYDISDKTIFERNMKIEKIMANIKHKK